MRIAVLGASGRTGRQVVETLLEQGHEVSALTRSAWSRPGVRMVQGNALDRSALEQLVQGAEAVICVLGPTPGSEPDVCSQATRLLIGVMRATGVRRLVVQTGAMIGHARLGRFYRWLSRRPGLAATLAERREQERLVQESGLDWTLIRPPMLTDGRGTGAAKVGDFRLGISAHIARRDLAGVLAQAATEGRWQMHGVTAVSAFTAQRPVSVLRAWVWRLGLGEMLGITAAAVVALSFMAAFGVPTSLAMGLAFLACMVAAGAIEGWLLGAIPGVMLEGIFPGFPVRRFTVATMLTGMLGWLLGMLPSTLMTEVMATGPEPAILDVIAVSVLGGAMGGTVIGLAQWLTMRRHVPKSARWIVATALGWALALPLDMLAGMLPSESSSALMVVAVALLFGLAAGVMVALPTGLLVIDLLREREHKAAGELPRPSPSRPVFV
jgi:uncharacterized protein YbjT (DUF2867 family)